MVLRWFRRAGGRVLAFPRLLRLSFMFMVAAVLVANVAVNMVSDLQAPAEPVRFSSLQAPTLPNAWLVCPLDVCVSADAPSVTYRVPAQRLAAEWDTMIAARKRVTLVRRDPDGLGGTWVQESETFGFRDRINMRIYPRGDDASTLAVFSRSETGLYDFGVNRRRVETWLERLAGLSDARPPYRWQPEFAPPRPEVAPLL